VLAVLSITAAVIAGYASSHHRPHELKLQVYRLEMDLRSARSRALYGAQTVGFTVDVAQNAWRYADQPPYKVSDGTRLTVYTGRKLLGGASAGTIEFFPNGQSSGGHIALESEGYKSEVDIDWMTGRIHLKDSDDRP